MKLLASLLLIASLTAAQDTTYCSDGWELYTTTWQGQEHHSCFWFGTNYEKVSHDSAKLLCEGMGGFMAEVPWGPHLNNWLVNKLIEKSTKNNLPNLKAAGVVVMAEIAGAQPILVLIHRGSQTTLSGGLEVGQIVFGALFNEFVDEPVVEVGGARAAAVAVVLRSAPRADLKVKA